MSAPAALRGPVLAGILGKAAEGVTLVLLATVVPRMLGPADYGTFSVALTVVAIGSVALTLGGATLLSRYVPVAAPDERAAVAVALTRRLARGQFAMLGAIAVVAAWLAAWDPVRFPPAVTGLVVLAVALNVAATLALQADLGMGRALAWCARYPAQNAVLVAAVLTLHGSAAAAGGATAVALAAVVGFGIGVAAAVPLLRPWPPRVPVPDGALRFGMLQAAGGALAQLAQRGAVLAVALLAGSAEQTGFAALAMGIALAAAYAVAQLFTVSLPALAAGTRVGEPDAVAAAERALRRLAGVLVGVAVLAALAGIVALDVLVPIVFGTAYAGAVPAFGPALAMVVLAPLNALAVQAAALRTQPWTTLWCSAAGAAAFLAVAVAAVPAWGAEGSTMAALAGAAASALVAVRMLPRAAGAPLTVSSLGGAAAVTTLGVLL